MGDRPDSTVLPFLDDYPIQSNDELYAQLDCIVSALVEHFPHIAELEWQSKVLTGGKSDRLRLAVYAWRCAQQLLEAVRREHDSPGSCPPWRWAALAWTLRGQVEELGVLASLPEPVGRLKVTELEHLLDWLSVMYCWRRERSLSESLAISRAGVRPADYRRAKKSSWVDHYLSVIERLRDPEKQDPRDQNSFGGPEELFLKQIDTHDLGTEVGLATAKWRDLERESVAARIESRYQRLRNCGYKPPKLR